MKRTYLVFLVLLSVLVIDQALKIYIKTNFHYGESYKIAGQDWAQLHFIENEGMAFGITFGNKCIGVRGDDGNCKGIILSPRGGKILLSIFRLVMVGFLIYLLMDLIRAKEPKGLIVAFSMILAGAIGNIIDSAIYGVIFSNSPIHTNVVSEMFPDAGGYSDFLFGRVVDMFYFPLVDTTLPQWLPFFGGDSFEFFRPVFNVADSSITVGVLMIILFYHNFLFKPTKKEEVEIKELPKVESDPIS
ncbi:MAG: lipoprotein signal peptidase [Saprospiraceae bacterium]|nr:lipoprotein signal peptidase [Saprospiraceae bacterium]